MTSGLRGSAKAQFPNDLADLLHKSLASTVRRKIGVTTISKIVQYAYFASMRSEEGRSTICSFAFADPRNPDPDRPPIIRHHRQRFHRIGSRLPLSLRNIAKLAPIADTSALAVAVYGDGKSEPYIWGLVDQEYHHRRTRVFEDDASFGRAGVFQIEIEGPGRVAAFSDDGFVGALRGSSITTTRLDALHSGPVFDCLFSHAMGMYASVLSQLGFPEIDDIERNKDASDCFMDSIDSWIGSICRVLHRIQRYHHGGALLFRTSTDKSDLNIKHAIRYSRLNDVLAARVASTAAARHFDEHVRVSIGADSSIDLEHYESASAAHEECHDARHATDGAVAFIAALSQIDGLVVMGPGLTVHGFGAEIRTKRSPRYVYIADDEQGGVKKQRRVEVTAFGTRHRSMFRYCNSHVGAVGFVVSQDGDIRAITKSRGRVVVWENLNLFNYEYDAFRIRAARSVKGRSRKRV